MGMEISGRLHVVNETQKVTERFSKREFVLELNDNPRYPQYVQFQLTGDRCDNLDGLSVGDEVRVEFSLRGREWKSPQGQVKYFNSLDVWTIDRVGAGARAQSGARAHSGSAGRGEEPPLPDGPPPGMDDDIGF